MGHDSHPATTTRREVAHPNNALGTCWFQINGVLRQQGLLFNLSMSQYTSSISDDGRQNTIRRRRLIRPVAEKKQHWLSCVCY